MKILKKGKKKSNKIKFECKYCGCEFLANEEEYSYSTDPRDGDSIYECCCPECNNPCVTIK